MIFLIEYDRLSGKLIELRSFVASDAAAANSARVALELDRMNAQIEREIVILDAESEEQLRRTHRRYFEPIGTLADPTSVSALKAA